MDDNFPHTPSYVGVVTGTTFSHTPEEAMSVGLAKACVPLKNWFCYREKSIFALPLFCLFVMLVYNLDVIGTIFYFILSFHFIILFYFIILFDYTLMLWVIILLCPDVMGN